MNVATIVDAAQPAPEQARMLSALFEARRLVAGLEEGRGRPYGALETLLGMRDAEWPMVHAYALCMALDER